MKLTKAEQAELFGGLGDLLAQDDAWDGLSPDIIAELDRRMEEYRRDPSMGRTWEQVKAGIAAGEWRKYRCSSGREVTWRAFTRTANRAPRAVVKGSRARSKKR